MSNNNQQTQQEPTPSWALQRNRPTYDTVTGEFSPVSSLLDKDEHERIKKIPFKGGNAATYLGDAGDSVYDKNLSRQNIDLKDEFRGQNQPVTAKLGAGLAKALITTGTTAADGIIGTAVGLGNMVVEQKGSAFWDNPFTNLMNDINNNSEKWFPNYYTEQEKSASFIGQLGYANFWGDKFLKNLGFVAGMVLDGVATGGVSMEVLGGKAIASKLPSAIANAALKGSEALATASKAKDMIGLTSEIVNNAKQLNRINKISQGVSSILSAQGMARFMALDDANRFYTENYQKLQQQVQDGKLGLEDYNLKMASLKKASEGYGNADFLANVVVIGLSSGIQFKNLFTKGFTPTESIAKGIVGSVEKGYIYERPVIQHAAKIAKNILAESGMFQEQYAAQVATSDFYQKKFDGKKQDKIDDIYHSIYKGLVDAYGSREGWNQGLLGSVIGLIGVPTISNKGLDWGGGIRGDIREVREQNAANQEAARRLNEVLKSDDFKNNYQSLIRNLALEDEKNEAAVKGDKHEVLNKQHDQFINDALQFIRSGKYEDFQNNIKSIRNSNAEEVKQLFKTKTNEDVTRELYGLKPKALEGHVFEKYTSEEITDKLNESANKMLSNAKTIKDLYDAYSVKYPGISEDAKELLIYTASKLEDTNERLNDINKESISKFGLDINNYIKLRKDGNIDLSSVAEGMEEYQKHYERVLKEQELSGRFNPVDVEKFERDFQDFPKLIITKSEFIDLYRSNISTKGVEKIQEIIDKADEERNTIEGTAVIEPTPDDLVMYTNPDGETNVYKVNQIDENDNVTLTPTDSEGIPTGEADIIVTKNDIKLYQKEGEGKEEFNTSEPLNENEVVTPDKDFYPDHGRGLKDVSISISHSHYDKETGKTVVRNKDFDKYISSPKNDITKDKVQFRIDTGTEDEYKDKLWRAAKNIKSKLDKGEEFTKKEIDDLINSRRYTENEDRYNSLVDILPIKIDYITKDGVVFDNGLYYHDSNFIHQLKSGEYNVQIPREVLAKGPEAIKDYIQSEKEKVRQNRKVLLTAILSGKDVILHNIKRISSIPNNTGTNRRIDEVLKQDANNIQLGIALGTDKIWTGHGSSDMKGKGSPGNIFIQTNMTSDGEPETIKLNVSKLSQEHANILWDAIITRSRKNSGGSQAILPNEDVQGLTVGNIINLLTSFGRGTDIEHPNNVGKSHLKNKQLFIDNKLNLHYGDNILDLRDVLKGTIDRNVARDKFVNWAVNNKNYNVVKEIPELGIELNQPMTKKFKLGSWVSEGNDTYSGSLIKHGLVQTDVAEFENTGSLFHAPVTIVDLNESGLEIKPTQPSINKAKKEAEIVETQSSKQSNKPKNTGTKKIESSEKLKIDPKELEKIRSLPIGTDIYITIKGTAGEGSEVRKTDIPKLFVSVVDNKGKKGYQIQNPRARTYFDISMDEYMDDPNKILEVGDKSVNQLSKLISEYTKEGFDINIDTSKSVKKEVKEEVVKSEPIPIKEEPKIEEVKLAEEEPIDIKFTGDPLNDIDIDPEGAPFRMVYDESRKYRPVDVEKEVKWLHNKLGKDIPIELREGLINIANSSRKAFGQLSKDGIRLSNIAEEGTVYHEAFHRVSLLYLDPIQRENIYNEARTKYSELSKSSSDREVEENLAERFKDYIQDKEKNPNHNILGKIGEFFQNLWYLVKKVFTGPSRLTNLDIDKLFSSIQSGKFKSYKPLQENLDRLGFGTYEMEYKDRQLDNVINFKMMRSLIRGLSSMIMEPVSYKLFKDVAKTKYSTIDIKDSLSSINFNDLKSKIEKLRDDYINHSNRNKQVIDIIEKGQLTPELSSQLNAEYKVDNITRVATNARLGLEKGLRLASLYQEVLDNYESIFKDEIQNYIYNELGVKRIDKGEDEERVSNAEMASYTEEAYERSAKDNIANSIKFMLHGLHVSADKNPDTGLWEFVPFDEIWSRLSNTLHDKDTPEDMIKALDSVNYFPYQQLSKKLKSGSELLRTQFYTSLKGHRYNFINAMFKESSKKGELPNFSIYFTDADIQSSAKNAVRLWGEVFAMSDLVKEGVVSTKKLEDIFTKFSNIVGDYDEAIAKKALVNTEDYKNKLVSILKDIHIEVDNKTIDNLIEDIIKSGKAGTEELALQELNSRLYNGLLSPNSTLYRYATGSDTKSKITLEPKTLFKNESIVTDISRAYVKTNFDNISDNISGAGGGNKHVFSKNSYTTDAIHYLKNDDNYLDKLLSDVSSKYSHYLNEIKKDKNVRNNLDVGTFNALIRDNSPDTGREYLDISPTEDFLYKLNAIRAGHVVLPTIAGRKTYYTIKGLKRIELKYQKTTGGELVIPDNIIDIFHEYAKAEANKIENAWKVLKKYSKLDEKGNVIKGTTDFKNLVDNYHYVTEGKVKNIDKGQAYKYQHMFESFNEKGFDIKNDEDVRDRIRKILQDDIDNTIEYAKDNSIINSEIKNGKEILSPELLDRDIVNEMANKSYGGDVDAATRSIIADYTINTKISSIETMMMLMGDISFYYDKKSENPAVDYAKRLAILTSTGTNFRETIPVDFENPTYAVTTLTEQKLKSRYLDLIKNKQRELLLKKYNKEQVEEILKRNLRGYTEVSPTDAMVLISPNMYKGESLRLGEWGDKEEVAFNLLHSDKELSLEEENVAMGISEKPLKDVYFERVNYDIDDNNKLLIPTFDKMAKFVLNRRLVKGTYFEDLLDRMEATGKYEGKEKICEAKFTTAVKTGNRMSTEYFKNPDEKGQSVADLSNIPVFQQSFRFLRRQVNTDPHEVQKVLLGTQSKKVTLFNINNNDIYDLNGKPTTGLEIKRNSIKALNKLSDKETNRLLDKLGADLKTGKMDTDLFYKSLLSEAKTAGMSYPVQEALRRHVPIDLLPEKKWILQRFAAMGNKYGINVHLPGQQLVLMSGYGLGLKRIPDETNNLRFLFDKNGKIAGTEIKISVHVFKDVIPGYTNKTWNQKVEWIKNNPNVLEGIVSYVPNQGQNSNMFVKVKEFLPEQMADVIIFPNELTTLTGKDFDIDKGFFVRYNYKTNKDGSISKVPFMTDENSTIDQRYDKLLNEAFYDNKYIFTKESYKDLQEARDNLYGSLDYKNKILGDDEIKLSTLFDLRKELSKKFDESTKEEKDFYHKQLLTLDSRIDDILYYNDLIKENDDLLKDYKSIIEETLVKNNILPSRDEFKKQHTEGKIDYFDQNTKQAIQNHYLDNIKSIFLSDHHFLSTSAPLGNITGRLKSLDEKVTRAEEIGKKKSLDFTGPVYQANLKHQFGSGALGKAAFSLNNSHHAMTQIADVSFKKDIGVGLKNEDGSYKSSLHEQYGNIERNRERVLISDWGSALIDAHVDIEKDPFIIRLNVVKPTYNVVALLIRTGVGEKTFEFTSQPILKDFSKASINDESEITHQSDKPITIVRDKWNNLFDKSLKSHFKTVDEARKEDVRIRTELANYNPLEDEDLLKLLQTPVRDPEWYYKQIKILELFNKLDKGPAKELSRLVFASRVDTGKWGTNLTETKMYIDSIKDLYKDNVFNNLDRLLPFDSETNTANDIQDGTFNSAYLRNGPLLINKLMSDRTITATKPFNDIIDRLITLTKSKYAKNKEYLLNHMADEVSAALMSRFFSDKNLLNLDSKKVATIMNRVTKFLETVNTNPDYKDKLKDNVLIQSLIKGRDTMDGLTFFGIPTVKSDDNFTKEDLTFAWQDLLQSNDINLRNFARELFVYSFYTSGLKRGLFSIFHYTPPSMFDELEANYVDPETGEKKSSILSFSDYSDGLMSSLQDPTIVNTLTSDIDKEIFKNNWNNPKYVPQLIPIEVQNIIPRKDGSPVIATIYGRYSVSKLRLGNNIYDQPIYRPYINYKVDEKTSHLMEYIGYHNIDKTPVYKVVGKMGYSNKGRVIKEYGLEESILDRNKIKEIPDEKVLPYIEKAKMYESFIYIPSENRDLADNKRSEEELENNDRLDKVSTTGEGTTVETVKLKMITPEIDKENLKKEISESEIYSDKQKDELHKIIDDKEVKSVEDINDLIKRICAKYGSSGKFSIRN